MTTNQKIDALAKEVTRDVIDLYDANFGSAGGVMQDMMYLAAKAGIEAGQSCESKMSGIKSKLSVLTEVLLDSSGAHDAFGAAYSESRSSELRYSEIVNGIHDNVISGIENFNSTVVIRERLALTASASPNIHVRTKIIQLLDQIPGFWKPGESDD